LFFDPHRTFIEFNLLQSVLLLDLPRQFQQNPLRSIQHKLTGTDMSDFKNINVAELETLLQKGGMRLIDVRTDEEIARGKIPQGEPLPLHLIPMRLGEFDKNTTTVFYCQMGGRSAQAASFAAARGFTDVYNLQGGITAWAHAGLPVA